MVSYEQISFLVVLLWMASTSALAQTTVTVTIMNSHPSMMTPPSLSYGHPEHSSLRVKLFPSIKMDVPASSSDQFMSARSGCYRGSIGQFGRACCGSGSVSSYNMKGSVPHIAFTDNTQAGSYGLDYYDISLVDGFNIPAPKAPQGGSAACASGSWPVNVNTLFPTELHMKGSNDRVIGRQRARAFSTPEYCNKADFNSQDDKYPATKYPRIFKNHYPQVYNYA